MNKTYDCIIIGSGSIGVPTALRFAENGRKVLVVDSLGSPGQGQDKRAIGGIRATHSNSGKMNVCKKSIALFSSWKERYGDDIHWLKNGYSFPAYTRKHEKLLKRMTMVQKNSGLNIEWLAPGEYRNINPHIAMKGLRGSTYSPDDGSASPLRFIHSAYSRAKEWGAEFRFNERVLEFRIHNDIITSVKTEKGTYASETVLNAAGNNARTISRMAGEDIPVTPDCHEAGITEPVQPCMGPMVVDIRERKGSQNIYFYQNTLGHILFCLTPEPPIIGEDTHSTSLFLPMIAKRLISLMPALAYCKVRRTWRGQYPMTPDGSPIVGTMEEPENLIQAVGMCGQGFMLGPGVGELLCRLVTGELLPDDQDILHCFDCNRDFSVQEVYR